MLKMPRYLILPRRVPSALGMDTLTTQRPSLRCRARFSVHARMGQLGAEMVVEHAPGDADTAVSLRSAESAFDEVLHRQVGRGGRNGLVSPLSHAAKRLFVRGWRWNAGAYFRVGIYRFVLLNFHRAPCNHISFKSFIYPSNEAIHGLGPTAMEEGNMMHSDFGVLEREMFSIR